jgi:thioredoxin reductase (NADPH)
MASSIRGKDVAVIGGGNSAVEEALYLANLAKSVTLVHRRDTLRAERILQQRLLAKENMTVRWNSVTEEMLARTGGPPPSPAALVLRHTKTGERSELAVDGVFVAIGHSPATSLFTRAVGYGRGGLPGDRGPIRRAPAGTGRLRRRRRAGPYRQAVTAAGTGCMAALEAEKFLAASEDQTQAQKAGLTACHWIGTSSASSTPSPRPAASPMRVSR